MSETLHQITVYRGLREKVEMLREGLVGLEEGMRGEEEEIELPLRLKDITVIQNSPISYLSLVMIHFFFLYISHRFLSGCPKIGFFKRGSSRSLYRPRRANHRNTGWE